MTLPEFCAPTPNSIRRGPFGSAIKKEFFVPTGYKVYEQQNAIYDDCELGSYFVDEQKFEALKSFEVGPGDIIISCSGTVGRIAILPAWAKNGVINQALLKLTLNTGVILPQYFLFLFRQKVDELMAGNVRGSAMVNITGVKDLKNILWPIPSLDEQREIVAEIEKQFTRLEAGVAGLRRVQGNLKRYRAAVLKAACEGKLVPTEAELARQEGRTNETGAQLLERILTERRQKWNGKGKYKEPEKPDTENLPQLPEDWTWVSPEQLADFGDNAICAGPFGTIFKAKDFRSDGVPIFLASCRARTLFNPQAWIYGQRQMGRIFSPLFRLWWRTADYEIRRSPRRVCNLSRRYWPRHGDARCNKNVRKQTCCATEIFDALPKQ